jgi:nucleoside phosphorylase
MARHLRLDD